MPLHLKINYREIGIPHGNIHLLGIELYKTRNNVSSRTIMSYLNNEIYSTIFDHKQILQQDQLALLIMIPKSQQTLDLKFGELYHLILEIAEALNNVRRKLSVELLKNVLVSYVFITSITLGMSISHIFGTNHSEVLRQVEKVPILGGGLMMDASVLTLSSLCGVSTSSLPHDPSLLLFVSFISNQIFLKFSNFPQNFSGNILPADLFQKHSTHY